MDPNEKIEALEREVEMLRDQLAAVTAGVGVAPTERLPWRRAPEEGRVIIDLYFTMPDGQRLGGACSVDGFGMQATVEAEQERFLHHAGFQVAHKLGAMSRALFGQDKIEGFRPWRPRTEEELNPQREKEEPHA